MTNPQLPAVQRSLLLSLPLDVIRLIEDELEDDPAAQLAFRLSCRSIYCSLQRCMLENLPEDYNPFIRPHLFKFLLLIQDENRIACGGCYRPHNIRNVLRHPSWREPSPYANMCLREAGSFNLCSCINITTADGYFLWSWFWGDYGIGAKDPVTGGRFADRIENTNEFLHQCRGPTHPLFDKYDITIKGYTKDVSPASYHRRFGNSPTFQLCFDIEYRFEVIRYTEPLQEDESIDRIKLCPHESLIYWDYFGHEKFDIRDRECEHCRASISATAEDQFNLVVNVTRYYGDSKSDMLPYAGGLEAIPAPGDNEEGPS